MGSKRVGLARTQALIQNLKREINWGSAQMAPEGVAFNTGCRKVQSFNGTLANIGDGSTTFGADDVLVELGALDVSVPAGMQAATKIIIDKIYFNVGTAAGQTLVGHLSLSATTGTAANSAVDTPTEIFGAGAVQVSPEGYGLATTATEADLNYNSAALTFASPGIAVATTLKYLYACTTTALAADATAGRFNVVVEYTVL